MTLAATEFLRRFFLHVLPKGFVRIRQFGFLVNRARASSLVLCRQLLASRPLRLQKPEPVKSLPKVLASGTARVAVRP